MLIGVVSMLLMITSIVTLVHAFDVVSVLLLGLMLLLIRFLYEKVRIVERAKLEDTSRSDVYTSLYIFLLPIRFFPERGQTMGGGPSNDGRQRMMDVGLLKNGGFCGADRPCYMQVALLAHTFLDVDFPGNVRQCGVLGCVCCANAKRLAHWRISNGEGPNYLDETHVC